MPRQIWIILGLFVTVLSVSADYCGLGQQGSEVVEFGYLQWGGTIAGVGLLLVGMIKGRPKSRE